MKKIIFLFILLLFAKNNYAQSMKKMLKDTMIWNTGDTLQMEDFKGKPKGKNAGATYTGIYFHTKEGNGTIKLVVEAIFVKSKSYLRENSEYVYKHERVHFDITEINARRMRKKISEKDFTRVKNIIPVIQAFYNKAMIDCGKEQDLYDGATEHGMNPAKQNVWEEKIAAELKELDAYAEREIDIRK